MLWFMKISSNDFSVERMQSKLYEAGFFNRDDAIFKWMKELAEAGTIIFVGHKPEFVADRVVGYESVFGLPVGCKS